MEDGLRRAEQAAGSFDNPGGMSGHAILDDGTRFDLSSGGDGRNLAPGHVAPPGTTAENFHHLENQVAAIMRRTGQNATLYITGSYGACKYCLPSMRAMLPDGGRLLLIWRNDSGAIRNRMFIGGADS
ncbi:DddA-like double-stranded DNA deaminase toxin [Streptomyces cavourensis]